MNTTQPNTRPFSEAEDNAAENQQPSERTNAMAGGHVAPSEQAEGSEEHIAAQARRAEQPEPDAKNAVKKDNSAGNASSEIINNTGDDADTPEADAATG